MNLLEAFRQPPEVTATAAHKLEIWPTEGYKATKFDPALTYEFFNREDELKYIKKLISRSSPEKVILLLGPRSCGKTAFIEKLMKEDEARFLHLYDFFTTPAEMAQALRKLTSKLPAAFGIDLRSFPMVSKFSWVSQFLTLLWGWTTHVDKDALAAASTVYVEVRELLSKNNNEDNNLTCVINGYEKVLLEAPPGKKPVFIFDEIGVMKMWSKTLEEQKHLNGLLNFLKRISKEQNKAHVILTTTDSSMVSWLEKKGFSADSWMNVVLGELTREEALRFVVGGKDSSGNEWPGLISAHEDLPPLLKEDWEKVWAMCGGNIKLLRRCVKDARQGDWGKAAESVGAASAKNVMSAWLSAETFPKGVRNEARLWTSEDYRIAVGLIADAAPYYAVPQMVVAAELEKDGRLSKEGRGAVDGLQVLLSMIEYYVLSVRPYSDMAKDIPREVFFRMVEGDLFDALKKVD